VRCCRAADRDRFIYLPIKLCSYMLALRKYIFGVLLCAAYSLERPRILPNRVPVSTTSAPSHVSAQSCPAITTTFADIGSPETISPDAMGKSGLPTVNATQSPQHANDGVFNLPFVEVSDLLLLARAIERTKAFRAHAGTQDEMELTDGALLVDDKHTASNKPFLGSNSTVASNSEEMDVEHALHLIKTEGAAWTLTVFAVEDNGIGIDFDKQDSLFVPFVQVNARMLQGA
jgi:hypothetical protein